MAAGSRAARRRNGSHVRVHDVGPGDLMRIGFDARYLTHGLIGGVRTYVHHLARLLPRIGAHHEFFFYIDTKAPLDLDPGDLASNVTLRTMAWRSPLSTIANDVGIRRWME